MVGFRALVGDGVDYEVSPWLGSLPGRGLYSGVYLSMYAVAMLAQEKQKQQQARNNVPPPFPLLPESRLRVQHSKSQVDQ